MIQPILFRLQQLKTAKAGATPLVPDPRIGTLQRSIQAFVLTAEAGSYALTGATGHNYIIGAAPIGAAPIGALIVRSTPDVSLIVARRLTAAAGSYALSGPAATY
jgi:hypothetical protein